MMNKQTIASIGIFDFTKVSLMETAEVYVDISELSEDLKQDVNQAIEIRKESFFKDWKICAEKYGWKWSDTGVSISPQLHIVFDKDKKITYELAVFFQDKENDDLFDTVYIPIDTMEHQEELKQLIINIFINKFF